MPRLLAIDYGTKRCGIAVSDPLQIIANGLTTVHAKDLLTFLETYLQKEAVELIIVGEPKNLNGQATDATEYVNAFVKQLKKKFPTIKISRIDERFTSKMAFQTMVDAGLKKKARQNKELVDQISATIILQSYMASNAK